MNKSIKKERKQLLSKLPSNYSFWFFVVSNPKDLEEFYSKGDTGQKNSIKRVLNYLRLRKPEKFESIKGKYWLKRFKDCEN